jgi:hypothetical protein
VQFYLYSTKLAIQDFVLNKPRAQDQAGLSQVRRLQSLNSILTTAESWLTVFSETPNVEKLGINVDLFAQFTHCLVVLFKLTNLEESGWDVEEVRQRADVFKILDHFCETVQLVPAELGIVDADGPRRGVFFKTKYLLRAIKELFLAEMSPNVRPIALQPYQSVFDGNAATDSVGDGSVSDDFVLDLSDEPWLSDIMEYSYAFEPDTSFFVL